MSIADREVPLSQQNLPTFESERLLVRPRVLADLEDCLAMDRDPEVTRYIPGPWNDPQKHPNDHPNNHRDFVLGRMTADYPAGLGYWSVVAKRENKAREQAREQAGEQDNSAGQSEEFLGWILLLAYPDETAEVLPGKAEDTSRVEIGWRFVRAAWGKGYASEASALVLKHALALPAVREVVADIDPENSGSIRVAEKIGLVFCGERRVDGEWVYCYHQTCDAKPAF
ncbi:GNAT family N-acetyltransferase [Kiloniella laminariae]|uniref:GNAT family N-acetyltransferase n=1 Tax=Kiloniella laminariae TaxID=454162 RepID=A0ABT4LFF6_9PROT|nr:GNAT family N-acetyltransferase [Kiloniella laminariae]MCZ4279819.1 GNAT family N-acetyltransferase [Kiloniella laminariae]